MAPRIRNSEPELSTQGCSGHELRRVQKLNGTLTRTRALADGRDHSDAAIAVLLAETRVLVLKMGRYEFGRLAGMHFHAVKNAETPGSHPQHESLSRIYRAWDQAARDRRRPPKVRRELAEAGDQLLELLVPELDERGRPLRDSVDGLYRVWMYQVGRRAFEAATRKTNRQHQPLTYGTLWQRREVGMIPDFCEIQIIGDRLGRDTELAASVWGRQKSNQLLARGMPEPLVRFTIEIQKAYRRLRMTAASIRKQLDVTEKTAQSINNGQMVELKDVAHVVEDVIPRRELALFKRNWNAALERMAIREDFAAAFPRICQQHAWTNHMLATLLQVCPPEERSGRKSRNSSTRIESYRPSAEIRRMYQENGFSGQAPAKAAIELIASEHIIEGNRGENQRQYLTRLFLEGVEQRLQQKGSGAHASPIRHHRILCGVSPQQLAAVSGYSKSDILLVERGVLTVTAAEERRLMELVEQFPSKKVEAARARLRELTSPPTTVRQAVTRLRHRHGGYIPLSRLLHDDRDRRLNLSPVHLKRIESGEDVPALPLLEHLILRGGTELCPELVADWFQSMPTSLSTNQKLRWTHPLVRGFGIIIFEKWHSLRDFWEEQFQDDFSYPTLTRNFQQLNGHGGDYGWPAVSRYLNAAGVGVADPRRTYLRMLFEHKDEMTAAIQARKSKGLVDLLKLVLRRWRREVRKAGVDPQAFEFKLGLTAKERESV